MPDLKNFVPSSKGIADAVLAAYLDEPIMLKRPFAALGDSISGHYVSASLMTLPPDDHGIIKDIPTIRWVTNDRQGFGVYSAFLPKGAVTAMVNAHAFYALAPGTPFELTFSGTRSTKSGHDAKLFRFRARSHVEREELTSPLAAELSALLLEGAAEFSRRHRCHWLEGQSGAIAALSAPDELAD
jgi:hypothetical protein